MLLNSNFLYNDLKLESFLKAEKCFQPLKAFLFNKIYLQSFDSRLMQSPPFPPHRVELARPWLCCRKASLSNLVRDWPKGSVGTMRSLPLAVVLL